MSCERCEEFREKKYRFCPVCGESLEKPKTALLDVLAMIIVAALSVIIIFELFTGVIKAGYVLENLDGFTNTLFLILPMIVDLFTIEGVPLKIYFILLLIAVAVSVFLLFRKSVGPKERKDLKKTPLYEMMILFAALYFIEFVFTLILTAMGVDIGGLPERPTWEWMFDLLQASVWEELITRVLFLGLPIAVIYLITKKEGAWKCIFGGFGISRLSLIFIVFSAFMFGAGHLTNWESWKFFTTFLFGIIAGYLFCKYGLYATISMHFLTDFIQAEGWLLGSGTVVTSVILFLLSLCAIPFIAIYAKKMIDYLKQEFSQDSSLDRNS